MADERRDPSVVELLEAWDRLLMSEIHPDHTPVEPVRRSGSVLRPGADEGAIVAAEARLGVVLPDDYKSFLRHSDGAYADWGGAILEEELFARSFMPEPGIGLLPIAHVAPMAEVDRWWTEMWVEGDQFTEPEEPPEWSEVMDMRPLQHALLITSISEVFRMVLVPVAARWELWDFFKEGATRHMSFASWLAFRTAALQPAVATPGGLRDLLQRAANGDERARLDILKVHEPAFEPLVLEALADPRHRGFVMSITPRWPSGAMVDALDAVLHETENNADPLRAFAQRHEVITLLTKIATVRAEEVLRSHGADLHADMARTVREARL